MFYLKEYFKSLGESLIRGGAFFFFSCLLAMALTHRPWLQEVVSRISPAKIINPYFVAVLDGSVDAEKVKGLAAKLPGVVQVLEKDPAKDRSRVEALLGQLGSGYRVGQELLGLRSLRVVLNPSLSSESLSFVRAQVVKLAGPERVTASGVRHPEAANMMSDHAFYRFLSLAGDWGLIAVLAFCWIVSYFLCFNVFRSRSYIIEKFQRRKLVAAKTTAAGLGSIVVLFTALGIWHGTLKVVDLVILFMFFSIFWTLTMKEWRWKPTL